MFLCCDLFCNVVLSVFTSFAIISLIERELVALFWLCSCCSVAVSGLSLFLTVPWVCMWSVSVANSGQELLFLEKFEILM